MKKSLIIFIVGLIILVLWGLYSTFNQSNYNNNAQVIKQEEMVDKIKGDIEQEDYSIDNPYVLVDPLDFNPLSALVSFEVDGAVEVSYEVIGENELTTFSSGKKTYQDHVNIPVIMLFEDQNNEVKINVDDQETIIDIQTDEVACDTSTVDVVDLDGVEKPFIMNNKYEIYDMEGNVRYAPEIPDYTNSSNKNIDNQFYFVDNDNLIIYQTSIFGQINQVYELEDKTRSLHHDMTIDSDGNLYALSGGENGEDSEGDVSGEVQETQVVKFNSRGKEIKTYDLYDQFIDNNKNIRENSKGPILDPMHMNSIDYNELDDTFIFSAQAQSTIFAVDADSFKVEWVFSPPGFNTEQTDKQLELIGDQDDAYTSGQHSAFVTENSKYDDYRVENQFVISVFDNNYCTQDDGEVLYKNAEQPSDTTSCEQNFSTANMYAINTNDMTIELIDQIDLNNYSDTMANVFDYEGDLYSIYFANEQGEYNNYLTDADGNIKVQAKFNLDEGGFNYRSRYTSENELNQMLEVSIEV